MAKKIKVSKTSKNKRSTKKVTKRISSKTKSKTTQGKKKVVKTIKQSRKTKVRLPKTTLTKAKPFLKKNPNPSVKPSIFQRVLGSEVSKKQAKREETIHEKNKSINEINSKLSSIDKKIERLLSRI